MLVPLLFALVLPQEPALVDSAVYVNVGWRVSIPRPFPDWVFAPDTAGGTATIIFQPARGHLSDQLWGALILAHWRGRLDLDSVADRRLGSTWQRSLGSSFAIMARESCRLAGFPCIHLVVTGAIQHAVLDVEEFLVARDHDLAILQLRYPRGVERDSIARGYRNTILGLTLGPPTLALNDREPRAISHDSEGVREYEMADTWRAIAPGTPTSDAAALGRRIMRWRKVVGECDTSFAIVGRYHPEQFRLGRLTVRVWREESADSAVMRASDSTVQVAAGAWATFWRAFGPVPTAEIQLVETPWQETRGCGGTVFLGRDLTPVALARELSRTWWGGLVPPGDPPNVLVTEALPRFSASLVVPGPVPFASSELAALFNARDAADPAAFREGLRALVLESRNGPLAIPAFLAAIGPAGAAAWRQTIAK